jgi:hypothetical protein
MATAALTTMPATIWIHGDDDHNVPFQQTIDLVENCALPAAGALNYDSNGRNLVANKGEPAQNSVCESDSFVCRVLQHSLVFQRPERFEDGRNQV